MLTSALVVGVLLLLYVILYLYRRRGEAMQDMITGLPSRDYFERYLQNAVARAIRRPVPGFGIVLLDIRGFGEIRRTLGGFAADEILANFAERVFLCIRPGDVLARLEGDNFGIVIQDVRRVTDVTRVAVRVHQSMTEAVTLAATAVDVRTNIGVTMTRPGPIPDAVTMLGEAEMALTSAIDSDRAYVVFDETLDSQSRSELTLETELSTAISMLQLSLALQPMIASDTGVLVGFTALVQWPHPLRGLLEARDFVPMAEGSRLILDIGEWMLKQIPDTLAALTEAARRPLMLTVNISEAEVERGDVDGRLGSALAGRTALGEHIRVELPISVLAGSGTAVEKVASRLAALGVRLHIDRAAAGSLPLWRAMRLGVAGVRVNLTALDARDTGSLRQVLGACRSIASEIVVEGIETPEALALVRELVPPVIAMGYQIARPLTLEAALRVARSGLPETNQARSPRTSGERA